MMRLVLTLLATLGFLWAAVNGARADEPTTLAAPAPETTPAPSSPSLAAAATPRSFGLAHRDARIVITAREESWVRVTDAAGAIMFMRTLKPGDSYRVPNRPGLLLDSGNARGLAFAVDGASAPSLAGLVRRSVALDPAVLMRDPAAAPAATAALPPPVEAAVAAASAPAPAPAAPAADRKPAPASEARPASVASAKPEPAATEPAPPELKSDVAPDSASHAEEALAITDDATIAPPATVVAAAPPIALKAGSAPTATAAKPEAAPRAVPAAAPPAAPRVRAAPASPEVARAAASTARAAPPARPAASEPLTGAAAVTPAGIVLPNASRVAVEVNKGMVLRLRQAASTVFVADPEIADIQVKSASLVYVFGKKAGETVLYAADDRDRIVLSTTVVVDHNVSRLRQALRAVAPEAAIDVTSIDGSVILTGAVSSPVEAENIRRIAARFVPDPTAIINQMQVVAPNQINLRVRVAEVSRDVLKSFGVNWESVTRTGNFLFGLGVGRDIVNATGTFPRNEAFNTLIGSYRTGSQDINSAIDALSSEGLVTVLAEPNLTALSGETAAFLAGGEFPIPLVEEDSKLTVEYKTFGVSLGFTPTVLDASRINLRVRPEVSQLSQAGAVVLNNISIPALTTRRAETTVELASGQSFVIAGLLQNNTSHDISRVPFLGDIPILGPLFRSDRFRRNETELVIIVTPYVVRPVSARVASPTDGFVAPNDIERILGGLNHRQQIPSGAEAPRLREGGGLIGPAGFTLD
jgi:pilus assembly protein CpaC